jgi:N,N-dimethylformamidase
MGWLNGSVSEQELKQVTGYCAPWSLRAGDQVVLRASSHMPGPAQLDLVRIHCGDPTRSGPGYNEEEIVSTLPPDIALEHQPLTPGSWGDVDLSGLNAEDTAVELTFSMLSTRPDVASTVACLTDEEGAPLITVSLAGGHVVVSSVDAELIMRKAAISRWYDVAAILSADGQLSAAVTTAASFSPGRDLIEMAANNDSASAAGGRASGSLGALTFACYPTSGGPLQRTAFFDGRLARPKLTVGATTLEWDLAQDMGGRSMVETSGAQRHGELHQLPTRAITGPSWDGSTQRWTDSPSMWDAVHFHADDLYDAEWDVTATLDLPADLPSGIYAFRVQSDAGDDRVPFFVRPAVDAPTADVALLMSSCTYMAYANHHMLFAGADFFSERARLRPEHEYVRQHPELGRSMYEKHPDNSGVMYSSRNRPVLQVRPGADGWNFTPDTNINAFLEQLEIGHDIIGDEDVHFEGVSALAPYRVIVTCSHPEYWSTEMLDALEEWQRNGGRLMYLGGNGFYWRVAFSDAWPGTIELRRCEDGVRNWQTGPGESYHSFNGEYGGLWRRLNRAPNEVAGVGFAAQGFDKATYYERSEASRTSRVAWIFDGVDHDQIGTSGLGGGAAGQEVDRYDTSLGSPDHAVVLASATTFGEDMLRTKEEFEASVHVPVPDPMVRADMVFYETPAGGAVFSVGSISWFGALARNNYDNDVAQITANVVQRFVDPTPFELG